MVRILLYNKLNMWVDRSKQTNIFGFVNMSKISIRIRLGRIVKYSHRIQGGWGLWAVFASYAAHVLSFFELCMRFSTISWYDSRQV